MSEKHQPWPTIDSFIESLRQDCGPLERRIPSDGLARNVVTAIAIKDEIDALRAERDAARERERGLLALLSDLGKVFEATDMVVGFALAKKAYATWFSTVQAQILMHLAATPTPAPADDGQEAGR